MTIKGIDKARTRLDNYYRIQDRIRECIIAHSNGENEFCAVCFSPDCDDHSKGVDPYSDALPQLRWWSDVAARELYLQGDAYILNGVPYPMWPLPKRSGKEPSIQYVEKVALDLDLIGVINHSSGTTVISSTMDILDIEVDIDESGITWGYIVNGGFYPLATFDKAWRVEDFGPFKGSSLVIGHWQVPVVGSDYYFRRYLAVA